jgi:hypothetical protein
MKQRLSQLSAGDRQEVYRQATKAIRAYGVVQPLDLMSAENRERLIQNAFRQHEDELTSVLLRTPDPVISIGAMTEPQPGSSTKQVWKSFLRRLLEGD